MHLYLNNIWIPIIIILPNIAYAIFPPKSSPQNSERPKWWNIIIAFERIGQIAVFTLPLFWKVLYSGPALLAILFSMLVFVLIYYICWIRYFTKGREFYLLYAPFLGLPIPLAIAPILYFFCVSILLSSCTIAIFTAVLAIGHIPESIKCYTLL